MSGGHFNYVQFQLPNVVEEIENIIKINKEGPKTEDGDYYEYGFSDETIAKFKQAVHCIKQAEQMIQRVDWLVSGDDGEESFHKRWDEELMKVNDTYSVLNDDEKFK